MVRVRKLPWKLWCPRSLCPCAGLTCGLPLSPLGRRTCLTASLFLLTGQRSSGRVDRGNRCLMKLMSEEAGYKLPGKANSWQMFEHESDGASCFYFNLCTKSTANMLMLERAFSWGYSHGLWGLSKLRLLFQGHSFCLPLRQILISNKSQIHSLIVSGPCSLSDKATHLNIKGIVQGSLPLLTGKSSNRESERDFRGLTYLCSKKIGIVRS